MLAVKRSSRRVGTQMSEPGQGVAAAGAADHPASASLFIVERRLPMINEYQLAVLQAALTAAASRFSARGDGVRYLRSIFVARQERLWCRQCRCPGTGTRFRCRSCSARTRSGCLASAPLLWFPASPLMPETQG